MPNALCAFVVDSLAGKHLRQSRRYFDASALPSTTYVKYIKFIASLESSGGFPRSAGGVRSINQGESMCQEHEDEDDVGE
jgi:hypothetical protein